MMKTLATIWTYINMSATPSVIMTWSDNPLGNQGHLERLNLDHEEEHFHEIVVVDEDWLRLLNSCFHLTGVLTYVNPRNSSWLMYG